MIVILRADVPTDLRKHTCPTGRTSHLGWMALTGSLAVHSHICFVAFVVPTSLYALFRVWAAGEYRLRTLPAAAPRATGRDQPPLRRRNASAAVRATSAATTTSVSDETT